MPGVHAVLTHEDVPGEKRYGLEFADQPVLAFDEVRYFGEPVAVVAAEHPEQARRAAEQVRVEYEPLEPVVDPERATEADPIHPQRWTDGPRLLRRSAPERRPHDRHPPRRPRRRGRRGRRGDVRARDPGSGLPRPGVRPGRPGRRGRRRHLRRHAVAPRRPRPGGAVPRADAEPRAHPPRRRRRRVRRARGPLDADPRRLLALHTNRPVKFVYNREESFVGHIHRHPARIWMRHGANRDGKLVSVQARILLDGGAYASSSTAVTSNAASFACGPYSVPNALARGDLRLHEQPALRRHARLRLGAVLLRARGADGQARRRARARPRRAAPAQRARARGHAADRPGRDRLAARSPR